MPEREDDERTFWRRYRGGRPAPAPSPCPGEEALAAFLEGRLEDEERERLLAHLVGCSGCLAAVEEAWRIEGTPLPALTDQLLRQLQGLVLAEAVRPARRWPVRPAVWLRRTPDWLVVAVALAVACWTGFFLGRGALTAAGLTDRIVEELTFGLGDSLGVDRAPLLVVRSR